MWPFKRKKTVKNATSVLPTEVQDYYEASRRERKGIAWLLGIATLAITLLLALLLFFTGRWVYRKFIKNEPATTTTTTTKPAAPVESSPEAQQNAANSGSSGASSSTNSGGSSSSSSTNSSSSSTNSANSSTTSGSSSNPLPRTGPDQDL